MNVLQNAISHTKYTIPRQVLEAVFINRSQYTREAPQSIDQLIMAAVVKPRVFVDCNLVGGTQMFVPLSGLASERVNMYTSVYKIPKSRTGGRSIQSVLNVTFSDPTAVSNMGVATGCQSTEMLTTASAMLDSMGTIPITSTAQCQLIAENVVMVRDTVMLPPNIYLRCIVANDDTMSHIQLRSYRHFAKLVEYAVKAYIYNEYVVTMDVGELYGGQTLGRFREIIDGYSDMEELYQTHIKEVIGGVSFMNDTETYTRHLRLLVGGRR